MVFPSRSRSRQKKKKKGRTPSQESADRSRDREKRRRKQQQQFVQKNRGPTGLGHSSTGAPPPASTAQVPGTSPVPQTGQQMFWDGFQWVPRAVGEAGKDQNATR